MTITLNLSDELVTYLEQLSEPERNLFAQNALEEKIAEADENNDGIPTDYPGKFPNPLRREDCTPEEIAVIERGFADIAAGRVTEKKALFSRLYAKVGQSYPEDKKAL